MKCLSQCLRGSADQGFIHLLLDGADALIRYFRGDCIFLFIHIVLKRRLLNVRRKDAGRLLAEVLRNDDTGVITASLHTLHRLFLIHKLPSNLIIFMEIGNNHVTDVYGGVQLFDPCPLIQTGHSHPEPLRIAVRIPVRRDVEPRIQRRQYHDSQCYDNRHRIFSYVLYISEKYGPYLLHLSKPPCFALMCV